MRADGRAELGVLPRRPRLSIGRSLGVDDEDVDDEALRYGTMVADAYLDAPSFDESQAWRWKLLIDHVERLFERIQRGKQGVKVVYVEGQPYADERELQN